MTSPAALTPVLTPRGYAHRADLLEAGWRPDAIRAAIHREGLVRAGRSWILLPSAAPALHTAAVHGAVVTCVSAAAEKGLWRPGHDETMHVAVPPHGRSAPETCRVHWTVGVVARLPRSLIDPVENVLAIVAQCQPYEDALSVWNSALRMGSVTPEMLGAVAWKGDRARALRDVATALSDSGTETLFVTRMLRVGVAARQQVKIAGHHVDALIGERLVVQIDGYAHHSDARQRRADIAHDRALRLLGYTVFRFDYHQVVNDWDFVEAQVLSAIAQNLHLPR